MVAVGHTDGKSPGVARHFDVKAGVADHHCVSRLGRGLAVGGPDHVRRWLAGVVVGGLQRVKEAAEAVVGERAVQPAPVLAGDHGHENLVVGQGGQRGFNAGVGPLADVAALALPAEGPPVGLGQLQHFGAAGLRRPVLDAQLQRQSHDLPHLIRARGRERRAGKGFNAGIDDGGEAVDQRAVHVEGQQLEPVLRAGINSCAMGGTQAHR